MNAVTLFHLAARGRQLIKYLGESCWVTYDSTEYCYSGMPCCLNCGFYSGMFFNFYVPASPPPHEHLITMIMQQHTKL